MMDRNREARRAAAMANGLHRRRHRTTNTPISNNNNSAFRDSPEGEEEPTELETARLRDRAVKKERDRMSRIKRRRGDGGSGGGEDSSEESVNDEEEDDEEEGQVRYGHPPSQIPSTSTSVLGHRKSYPPPSKVYRVTPSWKAPDEMIGVSIPRKARSASTKRSHECWSSGGVSGEQNHRQSSPSPVRSTMGLSGTTISPSPSPAHPMSPSSSNLMIKKKTKPGNGPKNRPPKASSLKSSSPVVQNEIEIEVAEVLYGLMRQSQAPPPPPQTSKQDSLLNDSRSTGDSKSRVSSPSPIPNPHLTVVAPKRKRPRPSPDETVPPSRSVPVPNPNPVSLIPKQESDQHQKQAETRTEKKEDQDPTPENGSVSVPVSISNNGEIATKLEEPSSSPSPSPSAPKVESTVTSTKPFTAPTETENRREDKFEIDLMMPAPEKEEDMVEYGRGDDKEMEGKIMSQDVLDDKAPKSGVGGGGGGVEGCDESKATMVMSLSPPPPLPHQQQQVKERDLDLKLDLEKTGLNFQLQKQPHPKIESQSDKIVPLPMSVPAGWHGGLAPMGYVGPLQGVVSMDGTTMASPPIQPPPPHFLFSQPRPKRCATHCYIARSIAAHQQMIKMNPFWPPVPVGPTPILGAKSYNLNMVPSSDLLAGRGSVVSSVQDTKGQPYPFFPGQPPPSTSKDKSPQPSAVPDSAQKKQFLVQPGLPPGSANNLVHGPALFFPMGHQQAPPSARPGTGKSPSMDSGAAASTSTSSPAPMGAVVSNAPPVGPAMSFSYPNMNGNETQFMAILGNGGAYPFPIPAHVGPGQQYRGTHPQAMSFLNGPFYSSPMLHPSQLQQAQPGGPMPSQSMQMQQQNHQIASMSTASSSSQKQFQSQQQRHQGSGSGANNAAGSQNQNSILQNFQGSKSRDLGGDDSPSSADSRNRPNMSLYAPNFPMPFHNPNFTLIPSSFGGGAANGPSVSNSNNHSDKKQQPQQAALNAPFPMSFATINGANTPGLDISSMAHNQAFFQNLPDAAKQSYQMMAAAAAAQQRMSSYRGPNDGKNGSGMATDPSILDEQRRAVAARASPASVGQSIAFSRDSTENSVVDSSARSLNLAPGSTRPARSSGPNNPTSSSNSQQQQHQSQMLFPKQQQYTPATAGNARSKTPSTSNGNVYPDHLNSSPVMAAKVPNSLSGFPSLVQSSVGGASQSQWKNSVRPNTPQMSSPSTTTATANPSNLKSHPQQQGRPQQSHTQISFGAAASNSKPNPSTQPQQNQNSSQTPSSPMMVGSPSNSTMSKSAGGSPRTSASNKSTGQQPSTLSSQQGKNSPSPSPSLSSQKPSILGGPHTTSTSGPSSAGKPQMQQQQPHQQSQLSKQSIQHAQQLYFNNYMQQAVNTSGAMAGPGYYLQRHRPDNQQPQGGPKPQGGSAPPTSSSGMLSLCTPVSFSNVSSLDPAKAAPGNNMKGSGVHSQAMFNAAAAQSGGSARPYPHTTSISSPAKPAEQKQPSGE